MSPNRLVAAVSLILLAGCVGAGERVTWVAEFEYGRWGGVCETDDGPAMCELRILVRDDGTWSATGVPDPSVTDGTLALGAASELKAVVNNAWRDFTAVAFEGVCPTARDGEEYGYVVREIPIGPGAERADARVREIRSCWYDLERSTGLMRRNQVETAWLALKPPELADIEFR